MSVIPALRPSLELLRPAPLRCGEKKGHSEQCGRKKAARPQEMPPKDCSSSLHAISRSGLFRWQIWVVVVFAIGMSLQHSEMASACLEKTDKHDFPKLLKPESNANYSEKSELYASKCHSADSLASTVLK